MFYVIHNINAIMFQINNRVVKVSGSSIKTPDVFVILVRGQMTSIIRQYNMLESHTLRYLGKT